MTKIIRIENADVSDHNVLIQIFIKGSNGEPDNMVGEKELNNPTEMCEVAVWEDQYIVIKEAT